MNNLTTMTMTLPNGATRTGREILEALERCKALDPAQMVKGWNIHPQTAAEAIPELIEALRTLEAAAGYQLTTYTPEELDEEAARAERRAQRIRAEEQLRAPKLARGVALQGVLWTEDETLFTGRAAVRMEVTR